MTAPFCGGCGYPVPGPLVSNFEQAPTAELQARDRPVKSSWTGSSRKLRLRDTHNPFKQLNLRAK